jgi:hypothetical protein
MTLCGDVFMSLADMKRLGEEKTQRIFGLQGNATTVVCWMECGRDKMDTVWRQKRA